MPAVRKYLLNLSPPVGYSTRHSLPARGICAVDGTAGLPCDRHIVAVPPSSCRCNRCNWSINCRISLLLLLEFAKLFPDLAVLGPHFRDFALQAAWSRIAESVRVRNSEATSETSIPVRLKIYRTRT